jgi:hypothetical protein
VCDTSWRLAAHRFPEYGAIEEKLRPEMTDQELTATRLSNQRLSGEKAPSVAELVEHFGAVQAQDFAGALWAIAQRLRPGRKGDCATAAQVETAIAERSVIRTWPMRGTLHFVPAADARWMIRMLGPRVISSTASYRRKLEIDRTVLSKSRRTIAKALEGGRALTRPEAYALLEKAGIETKSGRGLQIMFCLAHESLVCFGSREGKQHTFVLLDEWTAAASARDPGRDEALSILASRYFASHGPASVRDFAWWTGLSLTNARLAHEVVRPRLKRFTAGGRELWGTETQKSTSEAAPAGPRALLLPNYDEYIVGYTDRSALSIEKDPGAVDGRGNILFMNTIVLDGRIVGTWSRRVRSSPIEVELALVEGLDAKSRAAIDEAVARHQSFMAG